ncbi:hypothetical protein DEU56DRAFT_520341 [Suillus clintonianus]|uniref:uncharacterized protein n=1 Tax=Suillus clintonianus TaxID=1904413 RepID=UPI001B875874|nr:uncharacterized protein DEU56DRAFT_520341 [Suillus clintonianus]KAG2152888.1 hypothetical protein DEU56DRAFT_520341 [Suillus clintonianus]
MACKIMLLLPHPVGLFARIARSLTWCASVFVRLFFMLASNHLVHDIMSLPPPSSNMIHRSLSTSSSSTHPSVPTISGWTYSTKSHRTVFSYC